MNSNREIDLMLSRHEQARLRADRLTLALECLSGMTDTCLFHGRAVRQLDDLTRSLDEERLARESEMSELHRLIREHRKHLRQGITEQDVAETMPDKL